MILKRIDGRTKLEKEIDSVIEHMNTLEPHDPKYGTIANNLKTLYEAKSSDKHSKVGKDTLFLGAVAVTQTVMILWREQTNVVTSKALNWVLRGRV